jgi:hypothetical protein
VFRKEKRDILNNQRFATTFFVCKMTNSELDIHVDYVELVVVFLFPVGGPSTSYIHGVIGIIYRMKVISTLFMIYSL